MACYIIELASIRVETFTNMGALIGRNRWFFILVVIPTLVAAIYFALIASDRYVSESRFVIKSEAQRPAQTTTLANLIQSTGLSSGQEQTNEVLDYIRSRDGLRGLAGKIDLSRAYGGRGADWFSRYPQPLHSSSFENLYRFYTHMIDAKIDTASGMAVLHVEAFTPADAAAINAQLLAQSQDLVNQLNTHARKNAITEDEREVALAEQRLRNARIQLAAYRNRSELLDPLKQASGVFEVSTKLVTEQAALNAQLDLMRRVAPANPTIPSLESRIAAVNAQIDLQNGRAVGGTSAISSKLTGYESIELEQEFATQMLNTANAQLAQANADAVRQQFYLERVVNPDVPDQAALPHRLLSMLTVAGVLLCLYFVGWMLFVGILEHAPED